MPRLCVVDTRTGNVRFGLDTPANEGTMRRFAAESPSSRSYHRIMAEADPKPDELIVSADLGKTGTGLQVILYVERAHRGGQLRLTLHTDGKGSCAVGLPLRQLLLHPDVMQLLRVTASADAVVSGSTPSAVSDSTVVADRTARLVADHEHAASRGLAGPPPVYALGTPIVALGRSNWKSSRREWSEYPTTVDGLTRAIEVVRSEQRSDVTVSTNQLRMGDDGRIRVGSDAYALEENGFKQLLSMLRREEPIETADVGSSPALFPAAMAVMSSFDPDHRAWIFNSHLARNGSRSQELQLRARVVDGKPQIFSVTSTGYNPFDADAVATQLRAGLYQLNGGRQARGPVVYDPRTTTLKADALWHADLPYDGGSAGDYFKGGMSFRSNDAKGGGIRGFSEMHRNLCLNLIIVARSKKGLFSLTHRSGDEAVVSAIRGGLKTAEQDFGYFLRQWGILHATPIAKVQLWGQRFEDVEAAIKWAVAEEKITAAVGRDVLLEALLGGYNVEGGETLDCLVNAITRTHDERYSKLVDSIVTDLEQQAGELVYVLTRAAAMA